MNHYTVPTPGRCLLMAFAALLVAACHATYIKPAPYGREAAGDTDLHATGYSYLMGIFPGGAAVARCRDGIENIEIYRGPVDALVHAALGGLVTTRSIHVTCQKQGLFQKPVRKHERVTLRGLNFESNSAALAPGSDEVLNEVVELMRKRPSITIRITGHTDSHGKEAHNVDLSLRRALAAKEFLVDHGIVANRIHTEGKGFKEPLALGDGADLLRTNRRIELEVIDGIDEQEDEGPSRLRRQSPE